MTIRIQIKDKKGWVTIIEGEYDGEVKALTQTEAIFIPKDPRIVGGIIKVNPIPGREKKEGETE